MKQAFLISFFIILTACGGGGGGSVNVNPTGYDFTTTRSLTRGMVSVIDFNSLGQTPDVHSEEVAFTSELSFGGFNFSQNASTDAFSVASDTLYSATDLNATITSSHITSGPTSVTTANTLSSTNYTYGYYDSSIGQNIYVQLIIPTNYPNQTWFYWDNDNYRGSNALVSNIAISGTFTPFASIPSSGTATYTGGMEGYYNLQNDAYVSVLNGAASFSVNWATNKISGSFSSITETKNGAVTSFNNLTMPETDIVSSTYGSYASFNGDLTGTGFTYNPYNNIDGTFMGSSYESIGGVWEIQNNGATGAGAGYFAVKK